MLLYIKQIYFWNMLKKKLLWILWLLALHLFSSKNFRFLRNTLEVQVQEMCYPTLFITLFWTLLDSDLVSELICYTSFHISFQQLTRREYLKYRNSGRFFILIHVEFSQEFIIHPRTGGKKRYIKTKSSYLFHPLTLPLFF